MRRDIGYRWPFMGAALLMTWGVAYYLVVVPIVTSVISVPVFVALEYARVYVTIEHIAAGLALAFLIARFVRQ